MGHKVRKIADPVAEAGRVHGRSEQGRVSRQGRDRGQALQLTQSSPTSTPQRQETPARQCGKPLRIERVIEIGNIFKLGTRYSVPLKANYLDENGAEKPIVMGSYGIGPARIAAAAVEQGNDENGIIWPLAIAPYQILIVPVSVKDARSMEVAEEFYAALEEKGFEVLMDDRDERAGVKFKDADLIGIPYRIIIGEKNLKEGLVEIKERKTGVVEKVKIEEAVETIIKKLVMEG